MINKIPLVLFFTIISGCAVPLAMQLPPEPTKEELAKANYGEKPTQYKKVIVNHVKSFLTDLTLLNLQIIQLQRKIG